jgi:hypothetical protein
MKSRLVAIVDRTSSPGIAAADLARLAAALQVQLDRDYLPVWGGGPAKIVFSGRDGSQPNAPGVWPIYLLDSLQGGEGGVHLDTRKKHPYAEVSAADKDWTVAVSHELLEMLTDPLGNRFVTAPSLDPKANGRAVHFLVEVGDPCEVNAYGIDGIDVSDFVTPDYYDVNAPAGTELDFLRQLTKPFEVGQGDYISWLDPADGRWHQIDPHGNLVTATTLAKLEDGPREDRDNAIRPHDPQRHHLGAAMAVRRAAAQTTNGRVAASLA